MVTPSGRCSTEAVGEPVTMSTATPCPARYTARSSTYRSPPRRTSGHTYGCTSATRRSATPALRRGAPSQVGGEQRPPARRSGPVTREACTHVVPQRGSHVQPPEDVRHRSPVLVPVEAVGVRHVGGRAPLPVAGPTGDVADVADDGTRLEQDLPAPLVGAPAPFEVLDIHEEALVEGPDLVQRLTSHEERRSHGPVHRPDGVVHPHALEQQLVAPAADPALVAHGHDQG